ADDYDDFKDDANVANNDDNDFVNGDADDIEEADFENSNADDEGLKEFLDKQALKDSEEFAKAIEEEAHDGEKNTADQLDGTNGMAGDADDMSGEAAAEALAAVCNQRTDKTPHHSAD
ncbi:hypothetical protein GGF43_003057, partial [Coemansia sp. RSA 2618]